MFSTISSTRTRKWFSLVYNEIIARLENKECKQKTNNQSITIIRGFISIGLKTFLYTQIIIIYDFSINISTLLLIISKTNDYKLLDENKNLIIALYICSLIMRERARTHPEFGRIINHISRERFLLRLCVIGKDNAAVAGGPFIATYKNINNV